MQASVRSTWLAVGPGRDSLLLGSPEQCRGPASTTCPALVQRSCCAVLSLFSHFYSESLNVGWLSVITGMPAHLFGKQGKLSPWTHCLLGIPSFFTPSPLALYVCAILPGF